LKIHFFKYQATGNDFVLIDNRQAQYKLSTDDIKAICHRKFGVGADGLMLVENHPDAHFNLVYYNSDGSQSLCGNGSRAAVQLAARLGLVNGKANFEAFDGLHYAEIGSDGEVKLKMNDVGSVRTFGKDLFINTGSPHYIRFVDDAAGYPVVEEGRRIRYGADFAPGGTNVNFVECRPDQSIFVRTYERGVEDETLSCGTGVTAAAIAASLRGINSPVKIVTLGGDLQVEFKRREVDGTISFHDIYLIGPAKMVFEGDLEL